ncbi:GTP 3',8-cyclase MoaA [Thalassotalea sp. HSM 43]|uniref:GTP 3',8-cyclase MoaA n=1 Tax=Thalassotalea sp. HSM 43 TaxID=2552945 RepID=UPI0010801F08|nr:GTP 3',8-cyclase MoaA [Thalassotalea sp. HSM 43]QBY03620.1 GTP 3',8-cyclase MoaA [Thalassotalea sp. HSM 43]
MLKDVFGRRFYYLRLSITDVCNFRCEYCLPDGYQCEHDRQFLTLDEISRVARGFARLGTEKIRITGGEPALRKDLPQAIELCKQTSGINTVALTTNGFNMQSQYRHWMDAGLDALNVSIDSFDPRQFAAITGKDKLDSIMSAIDNALCDGFQQIKINTVLMREYNGHDLQQFFRYVKDKPISLRFIELMQTGDNRDFYNAQHVSGQHIKNQLLVNGWIPQVRAKTAGPAEVYQHSDYQGSIGLIMPYDKDFCATCNRLRVSSLGNLHLCLFSEQGLPIRQYLQTDDTREFEQNLVALLQDKKISHLLHDGLTGATKHLSMLGG